jgi:hypothetical protein
VGHKLSIGDINHTFFFTNINYTFTSFFLVE